MARRNGAERQDLVPRSDAQDATYAVIADAAYEGGNALPELRELFGDEYRTREGMWLRLAGIAPLVLLGRGEAKKTFGGVYDEIERNTGHLAYQHVAGALRNGQPGLVERALALASFSPQTLPASPLAPSRFETEGDWGEGLVAMGDAAARYLSQRWGAVRADDPKVPAMLAGDLALDVEHSLASPKVVGAHWGYFFATAERLLGQRATQVLPERMAVPYAEWQTGGGGRERRPAAPNPFVEALNEPPRPVESYIQQGDFAVFLAQWEALVTRTLAGDRAAEHILDELRGQDIGKRLQLILEQSDLLGRISSGRANPAEVQAGIDILDPDKSLFPVGHRKRVQQQADVALRRFVASKGLVERSSMHLSGIRSLAQQWVQHHLQAEGEDYYKVQDYMQVRLDRIARQR
jgi:hypothetical protein